jgi:penicillin-binding protein 2
LRDKSQDFWSSEWAQINRPRYFRPVSVAYQPGSTIKPIVLAAAYTDRKVALDATIDCEGALDMKNPVHHRCWLYKQAMVGHGPLDGPEAIMRSCNIFFYTLGQRLQAPRLVWWFDRFGLGQTTGCGLVEEFAGRLPDLRRVDEPNAPGFELSHAIQMGIGQGPVEWTPLQAANAYATLARGGFAMPPTFTIQPASSPSVVQQPRDLKLDARGMDRVMSGLDRAVNDQDGTGHHLTFDSVREPIFNLPGVKIYGKSGTATATPLRIDTDGDGRITHKDKIQLDGDHAWFVGMIKRKGSSRPDYIVVVITEYAGSGGRAAGPVANQILHAMRAEGYL